MVAHECRFCDIIEGRLDASFVFRNSRIVAFMDKFPISEGHLLIVPVEHYESIFEIPEELLAEAIKVAKKISIAAKSVLRNVTGVTILQNNGDSAGQRIFHFHIHVIPWTESVGVRTRFVSSRKQAEKEPLDEIAAKIRVRLY